MAVTRAGVVGAALGGAMLVACGQPPREAPPAAVRPFVVAIASRSQPDSLLEVVARYTGTAWVNAWKEHGSQSDPVLPIDQIPADWLGGPVPRDWTLWPDAPGTRRVHVVRTTRGPSCEAPTMLVFDGTSGPDDRGVAIDTDQPIDIMQRVRPADREWADVERLALAAHRTAEPDTASAFSGSVSLSPRELMPEALSGQPVTVEYVVGPRSGSPALYYFETMRRTTKDASRGISVMGWAFRDASGTWTTIDVTGRVIAEDSAPVPTRMPRGIFHLAGHDDVLIGFVGYEGWATGIYRFAPTGLSEILLTPGGGC